MIVTPSAEEIVQGRLSNQFSDSSARVSALAGMLAEQSVQAQVGLGEEEEEALYEKE
jgi:hypothetical protein